MRCSVIGAGSWGTALAIHLAKCGHDVTLWDRNPDRVAQMNTSRSNPRYLKDFTFPTTLTATSNLTQALQQDMVVPALPSHALREVLTPVAHHLPAHTTLAVATKGIESGSLLTMDGVMKEVFGPEVMPRLTILYGPSFAAELAAGKPTAVAVAGRDEPAQITADAFHSNSFRAYHTDDMVGVCVGGSLKNVMAIACGISDGLDLGTNARAAIITRGLAEITRLAVTMGANPLTMMGLAGMGDLVLTCTGNLSRNRRVGLALGQGRTLKDILDELGEVAEGVVTAESGYQLSQKLNIELPITKEVYEIIHNNKPATIALRDLLTRDRRAERDN
jgi:glycerol-3-phosphate dehydrogenase (NAD(P)+)